MNAAPRNKRFLAAAIALALGAGCARVNNDRLTIGGETMPAIAALSSPRDSGSEARWQASGPSLLAGARDHWEPTAIIVPIDATAHHPHYTTTHPTYSRSPRARGVYPTAESALDLGAPAGPQAWELVAASFHAAADVILFIPRAVVAPPCSPTTSPSEPFERFRDADHSDD